MNKFTFIIVLLTIGVHLSVDINLALTGFIEIPENSQKSFDFGKIDILLINEEGKVTQNANPSENNGFFLLPIDIKKNYKLKIISKSNYEFEPKEHQINLQSMSNEQANKHLQNSAFNFKLAGISLRSRVFYYRDKSIVGEQIGQEGIDLVIRSIEIDSEQVIQESKLKSEINGKFMIDDMMPGVYDIEVIDHEQTGYKFKNTKIRCNISWENGQNCDNQIEIYGTPWNGNVNIYGSPTSDIFVLIKSTNNLDLSQCKSKQKLPEVLKSMNESKSLNFDCFTITDQEGNFKFENVPLGMFNIYFVDSRPNGVKFDNKLRKIQHSLKTGETLAFDLKGYIQQLVGRTISESGKGIRDVIIKVDGEEVAKSLTDGKFILKDIRIGEYDIEAIHPNFSFKPFKVKIDHTSITNNPLNQIKADFIKLCGKIDYIQKESDSRQGYQVQVTITPVGSSIQDKRATNAAQDGSYCFEVPPSDYVVRPTIIYQNKVFNVVPIERKVKILDEPALNVDFSREKLSISGRIIYDENIAQSIMKQTQIILKNSNGVIQSIKYWSEIHNGTFEFEDLFDESYLIQIKNDRLCFDKEEFSTNEYSGNVNFTQIGMWLNYQSEANLNLTIVSKNGLKDVISLEKNSNKLCLKFSGDIEGTIDTKYLLKNGMNKFTFNANNTKILNFQVDKIRVETNLKVDIAQLKKIYPKSISDKSLLSKFDVKILDQKTKEVYENQAQIRNNLLIYTFYTKPNTKVIVKPSIVDKNLGQGLVILQESKMLQIGTVYDSNIQDSPFEITIGKNLRVELDKSIEGEVNIQVQKRVNKDSYYQDEKFLILNQQSMNLGTFNGNYEYNIILKKEGFEFEIEKRELDNGSTLFKVSTLEISKIEIIVKNTKGQRINNVTVYITSAERGKVFKFVQQTDKNGMVQKQVQKGNYYLKAVLKEYEFDPPQTTFFVNEGETYRLTLTATRTQFSVYGSVRNFGGSDNNELEIEAVSDDQENPFSESTITDKNGKFRIMGLIPGKRYNIQIKNKGNNIAIPQAHILNIQTRDTKEIDFVLAEKWSLRSLKGRIHIDSSIYPSEIEGLLPLKVKLIEKLSSKESEEYEPEIRELSVFNFRDFEFIDIPIDNDEFLLEIRSSNSADLIFSENIKFKSKSGLKLLENINISRSDLNISNIRAGNSNFIVVFIVIAALFYLNMSAK